jgi:taurine dioxygenase
VNIEGKMTREASYDLIDVVPTGRALGAEVRGFDLRSLDDAKFAALRRAWHQHQVLLIRGQTLSDRDLIAFSRRFGDLDWAPVQETGRRFVEGLPEIYIVSNVKLNGEPIGSLGAGEAVWHTDMSYLDVPPMASMTAPTTAVVTSVRASPPPTIPEARRARSILWSARIPTPGGRCSISGAGGTPI